MKSLALTFGYYNPCNPHKNKSKDTFRKCPQKMSKVITYCEILKLFLISYTVYLLGDGMCLCVFKITCVSYEKANFIKKTMPCFGWPQLMKENFQKNDILKVWSFALEHNDSYSDM